MRIRRGTGSLLVLTTLGCASTSIRQGTPTTVVATKRPTFLQATLADGRVVTIHQPMINGDSIVGFSSNNAARTPVAIAAADVRSLRVNDSSTTTVVLLTMLLLAVAGVMASC